MTNEPEPTYTPTEEVTPTRGDDYRLYEYATYAATDRLAALRDSRIPLTEQDVLDLFTTYCGGCENAGMPPTLTDFGEWVVGKRITHNYRDVEPAEVVW
jgi:hypothetical protein